MKFIYKTVFLMYIYISFFFSMSNFVIKLKIESDSVNMNCIILLYKKSMLGSRTRIVLLTIFFTFAFAMLFFALMQNYANAQDSTSVIRIIAVHTWELQNPFGNEFVPQFSHRTPLFDINSDSSLQRYLSSDRPFKNINYIPSDLAPIDSNFTANNSKGFQLRQEAGTQFADLAWHFWNAFSGDRLLLVSAYRSKSFQDYLIKQWCATTRCAQAGTSEHQAWLSVDLKVISKSGKAYSFDLMKPNKYYDWLKANAEDFGFHNTYQKGIEIDGKISEWRHRRYMWIELAKLLSVNQQTFAEYYNDTVNN